MPASENMKVPAPRTWAEVDKTPRSTLKATNALAASTGSAHIEVRIDDTQHTTKTKLYF